MIVTRTSFNEVLALLSLKTYLSLDTETSGLRMYHGDRLFSIIVAYKDDAYYFNFNEKDYLHDKDGHESFTILDPEVTLTPGHLVALQVQLFECSHITWFIQNAANFDMGILAVDNLELRGQIHCTKAIGRVEYNDHFDIKVDPDKKAEKAYSLAAQLHRIGLYKGDQVKGYVSDFHLKTLIEKPGGGEYERQHYDRVPFSLMVPYGELDGTGTYHLGMSQIRSLERQDLLQPDLPPERSLKRVMENERRLQKTIFRMRHVGVQADIPYCKRAIAFENDRAEKALQSFKRETGHDYIASSKLFEKVFESEKDKWGYTAKGNPSFESDNLIRLDSPSAKIILELRDAKSKSDFYNGFLWFADSKGVVHPNFNPEGATHGRFSSSEPNFQNLTSEESDEQIASEFIVRRALIPRPGYTLIMPDYDQMEYKFMLEQACRLMKIKTELAVLVADQGFDFHEATSQNAARVGSTVIRKQAKVANFLTLYGGGAPKLAAALKISTNEAHKIRNAIFQSAPEIKSFINTCSEAAEQRGYTINWLGRRCHFPNSRFAYRAPNYIVSGGCADVVKVAMNEIDEYLLDKKSRMVMTIHDELPIEVHESELSFVPQEVKAIMERVYQSRFVPLTTGMEWSIKSLGDKQKGFPV